MKNKRILVTVILLIFHTMLTTDSFAQFPLQLSPLPSPIKPVYGAIAPVCGCETLTKVSIPNTTILSAAVDPKDGSCRVTAVVNHPPADDSVTVWIALPQKNWNGRFEGKGGGGFLGGDTSDLAEPVSQGFAAGATNTGHPGGSGSFALDAISHRLNWQLVRDNVYQGIHDMTIVGKALVKSYYSKPARYSYFVGNSTGGRQGLSEAQRFPNDYDGVLSYQPAINWDRMLIALLWPQVAMQEANSYPLAERFKAINNAVIGILDEKDGTKDSVIEDPLHRQIDPKILIGKKLGDSVFTEADAEIIRKIWEGPRTGEGKFLWYGLLPGADLTVLTGTKGSWMSGPFDISVDWVRYFLYLDPKWTGIPLTRKEFELLWNQSVEQYGKLFGTDDPDLTRFKDHGGKLILIHGLIDQLIPPQGTIDYYKRVQEQMGGVKKTMEFARLFLLPGTDHINLGPGPKPTNQFEWLVHWVEEGKVPDHITAELRDQSGKLIQSRSYAPYTQAPKMQTAATNNVQ